MELTRKPSHLIFAGIIGVAPSFAFAETATPPSSQTEQSPLERIEKKLDDVSERIERIETSSNLERKTFIEQPLGDRKYGVEFNFVRLLSLGESEKTLSGTFSLFDTQKNVEIAFPVMYSDASEGSDTYDSSLTSFTADIHYRKYLGHRLDGFYLSGFSRLAYLSGDKDFTYDNYYGNAKSRGTETKLGIGFGIGYRVISSSDFYWGMSLSVGRYMIGDSDIFEDTTGVSANWDDEEFIFDIELLKFGYAF